MNLGTDSKRFLKLLRLATTTAVAKEGRKGERRNRGGYTSTGTRKGKKEATSEK